MKQENFIKAQEIERYILTLLHFTHKPIRSNVYDYGNFEREIFLSNYKTHSFKGFFILNKDNIENFYKSLIKKKKKVFRILDKNINLYWYAGERGQYFLQKH